MTERKQLYSIEQVTARAGIPAPTAEANARILTDTLEGEDVLRVDVVWTGVEVERTGGHSWILPTKKRALAARLVEAINDGVVFGPAEIRIDVYGATYVSSHAKILGRTLNADLRRLGY